MGIELNVNTADINKMLMDAVLDSAIGTTLREVVEKKVSELGRAYQNPIEGAVDVEVKRLVSALVNEKFKPMIESKVNELMTEELVGRIATAAWNSLMDRLDNKFR